MHYERAIIRMPRLSDFVLVGLIAGLFTTELAFLNSQQGKYPRMFIVIIYIACVICALILWIWKPL